MDDKKLILQSDQELNSHFDVSSRFVVCLFLPSAVGPAGQTLLLHDPIIIIIVSLPAKHAPLLVLSFSAATAASASARPQQYLMPIFCQLKEPAEVLKEV